jgi:hypothetical protein
MPRQLDLPPQWVLAWVALAPCAWAGATVAPLKAKATAAAASADPEIILGFISLSSLYPPRSEGKSTLAAGAALASFYLPFAGALSAPAGAGTTRASKMPALAPVCAISSPRISANPDRAHKRGHRTYACGSDSASNKFDNTTRVHFMFNILNQYISGILRCNIMVLPLRPPKRFRLEALAAAARR